jgi:hypothetical protein
MDYGHLDTPLAGNATGVKDTIFYALKSDFLVLQEVVGGVAAAGDGALISATHTFNANKGWKRLRMTQDTVEANDEQVGDNADSLGTKHMLQGFFPGRKAVQLEFQNSIKNEDLVILYKDCNGTTLQLGCDCSYAKASSAGGSGKTSGGTKGAQYTFAAFCAPVEYTGDITEQ